MKLQLYKLFGFLNRRHIIFQRAKQKGNARNATYFGQ